MATKATKRIQKARKEIIMKVVKENPRIIKITKGKDAGLYQVVYWENSRRYRWTIPLQFCNTAKRRMDYAQSKIQALVTQNALPTLKHFFTVEYMALRKDVLSPGTLQATESVYHRFLSDIGDKTLDRLTPSDWSAVAVKIQNTPGLKGVSKNNVRGRIISVMKFCAEKYPNVNPPFDVIATKERAQYEEVPAYTEDEYSKLLAACVNDQERALLEMCSRAGLRKSEACLVTKADLKEDGGKYTLTINKHFCNAGSLANKTKILPGRKSNRADHTIPIPADLAALIMTLEEPYGYYRCDALLERLTLQAFGKASNGWHAFRRLACVRMAAKMPITDFCRLLGHRSINSSLKYYSLTDKRKEELAELI